MTTGSIKNPQLRIIPSKRLFDFILTLKGETSMPENVLNIYKKHSKDKKEKTIYSDEIPIEALNKSENEILDKFAKQTETIERKTSSIDEKQLKKDCELGVYDLKWLRLILKKQNNGVYLHELLENSEIILPENEIIERNPVLEARCIKLKAQQERREYNAMTKNVDTIRQHFPEDTIAYQMKQINRQLIAVVQFIFSVAAGFAFGFIGVELMIGDLDFGFRLLLGIICSLVIALAEIYFLAKKLNEDYDEEKIQAKLTEKFQMPTKAPMKDDGTSGSGGGKAHKD